MSEFTTENFDISKVEITEMVELRDYPDFSDSYIVSADYDGEPMTEDELMWFEENYMDYIWEYKCQMM
jgi:hypothetical protein